MMDGELIKYQNATARTMTVDEELIFIWKNLGFLNGVEKKERLILCRKFEEAKNFMKEIEDSFNHRHNKFSIYFSVVKSIYAIDNKIYVPNLLREFLRFESKKDLNLNDIMFDEEPIVVEFTEHWKNKNNIIV